MSRRRIVGVALAALAAYGLLAYLLLPTLWRHYERLPAMESLPRRTVTPDGLSGDPLNVALIGGEAAIRRAFAAAGWSPAVPVTLRSAIGIAESVALDRPDADAPVSPLLLWGRPEDLAFEREVGRSPGSATTCASGARASRRTAIGPSGWARRPSTAGSS